MIEEKIYSINGPVVKIKGATSFSMLERVEVGKKRLVGEVISVNDAYTTIQVYETTTGLMVGDPVIGTGEQVSLLLGPGILRNIFDGIERPLVQIKDKYGAYIETGADVPILDQAIQWDVEVLVHVGDYLNPGQVFAQCPETDLVMHRAMLSPKLKGEVVEVAPNGKYTIEDVIVKLKLEDGTIEDVKLAQKWPIKLPRPVRKRLPISIPLVTGQRVIDTMFPIAKGGTAAVPGGFGTGKTMTQHQIAKWCDAQIIVYVGCGERGNEMTQVLDEFSELIDPKTNRPLMDRTVLIANTSNMPVAAREASIYTGVTIAEYYRDMGYHVAMMADSTSRWAEALREISGRLEEMPAEEGFPAYLPSRLSKFYERAGYAKTLCDQEGSISIIGAVSPQGADFSEPVTQNTKRFVRCFWALDKSLAYMRHYAAINWMQSYSEYIPDLSAWYNEQVDYQFMKYRQQFVSILAEESKLEEVVKLIGSDVLPENQKLIMEVARLIRVGYLQQNAFHPEDTYVPLAKQMKMMELIIYLYEQSKGILHYGIPVSTIVNLGVFEMLARMKYDIANNELEKFDTYREMIDNRLATINTSQGVREWK